jgi:multimeric flavodoxin WrbA
MSEDDYTELVDEMSGYDSILVSVSSKFSELTREAKKIIDDAKANSDQRKEKYGVTGTNENVRYHHRELPRHIHDRLSDVKVETKKVFDELRVLDGATRAALRDFHDSKLRVLGMR